MTASDIAQPLGSAGRGRTAPASPAGPAASGAWYPQATAVEQAPDQAIVAAFHSLPAESQIFIYLADVTVRVYPSARHEILNETDRDEVLADMGRWIDRVVG